MLVPGMQANAEIHLGTRSVLEYLVLPVQKVALALPALRMLRPWRARVRLVRQTQATCNTLAGVASQIWPWNLRPFSFFERFRPSAPQAPHCLKKKAT